MDRLTGSNQGAQKTVHEAKEKLEREGDCEMTGRKGIVSTVKYLSLRCLK